MIIVGLTGGIASGKSYVISYLKKIKICTHESDKIVGNLYKKPTKEFLNYLIKHGFKDAVMKKNINKKIIRNKIFENNKLKNKLEIFIHKEVKKEREIFLKKNKKEKIIFLDIPLLFENNLEILCDYVCSTISPIKIRRSRALKRKGMNKKIFEQILKNQIKDKERKLKSNFIINTSQTKAKTCLQINNIIYAILEERLKK